MHNIILCAALLILGSVSASAQFYTITKETEIRPEKKQKVAPDTLQRGLVAFESCKKAENDSIETTSPTKGCKGQSDQKSYNKTSPKLEPTKEVRLETKTLPTLTIPNLYQEIIRNGIRHPKIVLAQAILETGWFRSPLCRNRHNLFGLTNPKPGSTMSSITGRKVSELTIPKCSTSTREETTCCGYGILAMRRTLGMFVR